MLIDVLQQYGFSEREAKVYLACLELGIAPASSIARRLDENRVTIYSVLKVLKKRGVVYETQKNSTTYYGVIAPEKLLEQQKEKVSKLEEKMSEFNDLLNTWTHKPKMRYYEWLAWIKQAYENALQLAAESKTKQLSVFTGSGKVNKQFETYLRNDFLKLRWNYPIISRMLIAQNTHTQWFSKRNDHLKDVVFVDKDLFWTWNQVVLYAEKQVWMFIYTPEELFAVVIESPLLFSWLYAMFNHFWNTNKSL